MKKQSIIDEVMNKLKDQEEELIFLKRKLQFVTNLRRNQTKTIDTLSKLLSEEELTKSTTSKPLA